MPTDNEFDDIPELVAYESDSGSETYENPTFETESTHVYGDTHNTGVSALNAEEIKEYEENRGTEPSEQLVGNRLVDRGHLQHEGDNEHADEDSVANTQPWNKLYFSKEAIAKAKVVKEIQARVEKFSLHKVYDTLLKGTITNTLGLTRVTSTNSRRSVGHGRCIPQRNTHREATKQKHREDGSHVDRRHDGNGSDLQ